MDPNPGKFSLETMEFLNMSKKITLKEIEDYLSDSKEFNKIIK
jgi:hypothetical protein